MLETAVMLPVTLQESSKKVLRVIVERGIASGADLESATGMTAQEVAAALEPLLQSDLIAYQGTASPPGIPDSFFNLRPSARQLAEVYLRR
jgi:hypothetical protein